MKKGIVFTLDALLAATVAASILTVLALSYHGSQYELAAPAQLYQTAQDVLTAMDKQGALKAAFPENDAQTQTRLRSFISNALPAYQGGNLTIEVFEYTPSSSCPSSCRLDGNSPVGAFCTCRRLNTNTGEPCNSNASASNCTQLARAQRMFYDYRGGSDVFGRATLEVWPK